MSKRNFPAHKSTINFPRRLREGLSKANDLLERDKQPEEALELLLELDKRYPRQADVLGMMMNAYSDLEDMRGCLRTIYKLHKINPNRADVKLGLAEAYLADGRLALAFQTFREFSKKWPRDERINDVQKTLVRLEEGLTTILAEFDLTIEDGLDFVVQHELLQVLMEIGEFRQCRKIAKRLIKERPDFVPTLNNLSQIAWLEGDLNEAIEISLKALEIEDDNVHALSNLARFLFMQGKEDDARLYAQRLIASEADAAEKWKKKAEALSFIGDDEGVLAVVKEAEDEKETGQLTPPLYHWAAVAAYNAGNIPSARKYWRKALKLDPQFSLARANLDALKLPETDRDCPQVFTLDMWLPGRILDEIVPVVGKAASKTQDDEDFRRIVADFFDKRPYFIHFVSAALNRGDSMAKEMAVRFVDMSGHEALLDRLKAFALGRSGTDDLRIEAVQVLSKHGVFAPGEKVDVWLEGEWKPLMMMAYEISYDPPDNSPYSPAVLDLMEQAIGALYDNDGVEAEKFLRKALKKQPDDPGLLNNLAMALGLQGREDEANELADRVAEDFPDYFFGQVIAARKAIQAGELERAKDIIGKMASKKQLHITEFGALCATQIYFSIADGQPESALSWYEMWKQGYPEDPALNDYAEKIELIELLRRTKNLIGDDKQRKRKNARNN